MVVNAITPIIIKSILLKHYEYQEILPKERYYALIIKIFILELYEII